MRSFLFVPADNERKLISAAATGADALIVDLEDSVADANKAAARALAADYLKGMKSTPSRPRIYLRINSLESGIWKDDIAGVIDAGPDGIMLPKPRSAEDVATLSAALDASEDRVGIKAGSTKIIAIVTETPGALLSLDSYKDAAGRLEGLSWGAEDLSAEIGAMGTRDGRGRLTSPFLLARNMCLFTACAARLRPIDTVFVNYRDSEGLRQEARDAARDGFTGKLAIHPDQVGLINDAFTPNSETIARARETVEMFAQNNGAGVIAHAGRMLDRPHLTRAKRILARAKLLGLC